MDHAEPDDETLDLVFGALADPFARAILNRLDGENLLVTELAEPFDISLQAVSRHIQVLVRAGLVTQERTGRISRCSLDAGPILRASLWLNRYSRYWQAQFDTLAMWLDAMSPPPKKDVPMLYRETSERLAEYRREIAALREKMRQVQAAVAPEEVTDYVLAGAEGAVRLSELFDDKDTLFVIHNMGRTCPNCTMWADGFNGVLAHLENRAAFVVTSPDDPATQAAFAASRGWRFRMVSHQGTDFAERMGYRGDGGWLPGVSVFKKDGGRILRVSDQRLGPGDDLCAVWHFFDMIPEGPAGWRARFSYP